MDTGRIIVFNGSIVGNGAGITIHAYAVVNDGPEYHINDGADYHIGATGLGAMVPKLLMVPPLFDNAPLLTTFA